MNTDSFIWYNTISTKENHEDTKLSLLITNFNLHGKTFQSHFASVENSMNKDLSCIHIKCNHHSPHKNVSNFIIISAPKTNLPISIIILKKKSFGANFLIVYQFTRQKC